MNALFIEFKDDSIQILDRDSVSDFPFARDANGRIGAESAARLQQALGPFRGRKAFCAIPARGVSLRTLSLPAGGPEEIARILPLQIEAQFPLPPSELAWGYSAAPRSGAKPGFQDVLVAAVKRETIEEYRSMLAKAGLDADFTLAALARCALAPHAPPAFGLLEADQPRSELICFDANGSVQLRGLAPDELNVGGFGDKLYITGRNGRQIASRLGLNGSVEFIETSGSTAANAGLKRLCDRFGALPLTIAAPEEVTPPRKLPDYWRWPVLAAALLGAFLLLRLLEPILHKPRFEKRLAEIQRYRDSLPSIERELAFLQYIKTNQPPFLDAISVLAGSAPRGTKFESLSMSRRGEITFRGTMGNPQAATEFRTKLIDSGLFAKVVFEEQTPDPNGQKLTFRLSAQIHSEEARKPLRPEPTTTSTNHARLN